MRLIKLFLIYIAGAYLLGCASSKNPQNVEPTSFYDFVLQKSKEVWDYPADKRPEIAQRLFIRGLEDYNNNNPLSAINYFESALKFDTNATIHLMLAESYMQIRDIDNALYHSLQTFLLDTNEKRALQLIFSSFIYRGDFEAAEKTINYIYSKSQSLENTEILAEFYSYVDSSKAIQIYENLYEQTKNPNYRLKILDIFDRAKNHQEFFKRCYNYLTENYYEPFLRELMLYSEINNSFDYLIKFYTENYPNLEENQKANAAKIAQDLHFISLRDTLDPNFKKFVENNLLKFLEDYYELDRTYDYESTKNAGYIAGFRGDTTLSLKLWNKALVHCDTCTILPKVVAYYLNLKGLKDSAVTFLKNYYQKFPDDSTYLLEIAYTYLTNNDFDKALPYLLQFIEFEPNHFDALVSIADCYSNLKSYQLSEQYYKNAMKINSEDATLNNNYAYMLTKVGNRLEDALRMAKIALNQDPDNGAYLDTYGWVLFKMGKYEESLKYLEKAQETGIELVELFEHLYEIYLKLGFYDKAYENLQKALTIEPNNAVYKKKLKELEKKLKK